MAQKHVVSKLNCISLAFTNSLDFAVLVIAIHSALQVFNPCPPATTDGLRPYRHYIFAGSFVLPALMAGLVFADPAYAYQSLGAFCMLPIRPFWYRLALQWIPRYVIVLTIFGLAAAIYTYVGITFRRHSETSQNIRDSQMTSALTSSYCDRDRDTSSIISPISETIFEEPNNDRQASSLAHEIVSSSRKESNVSFIRAGPAPTRAVPLKSASSYNVPEKSALASPRRPSLALVPSGCTIHEIQPPGNGHIVKIRLPPTDRSTTSPVSFSRETYTNEELDPLASSSNLQSRPQSLTGPGQRQMDRQRARIHRQLRLLFIYPIVYTLMWIIPFAMHCMNYYDRYALRPVWSIRIGSTILITSMGFVNFVVFTVRERPWKSIPTSDGTLWGSFAVWKGRVRVGSLGAGGRPRVRASLTRSGSDPPGGRIGARLSGSTTDAARTMVEQARVRLEMERVERLEEMRERLGRLEREEGSSGESSEVALGVLLGR
ncbi:hypothetical protein NX059_000621 [Plenodomus lindquistii]|nr:hypothetical protein NX059_000621 [Plenodomus lindquistii]